MNSSVLGTNSPAQGLSDQAASFVFLLGFVWLCPFAGSQRASCPKHILGHDLAVSLPHIVRGRNSGTRAGREHLLRVPWLDKWRGHDCKSECRQVECFKRDSVGAFPIPPVTKNLVGRASPGSTSGRGRSPDSSACLGDALAFRYLYKKQGESYLPPSIFRQQCLHSGGVSGLWDEDRPVTPEPDPEALEKVGSSVPCALRPSIAWP